MTESDNPEDKLSESMRRILSASKTKSLEAESLSTLSKEELQQLVLELLGNQSELQAENKKLLQAKLELEKSCDSYIADENLRRKSETLKAIVEASPAAIVTTDEHGIVTDWNHAATSIFGWTAQEIVGHPSPLDIKQSPENFKFDFEQAAPATGFALFEGNCLKKDSSTVELRMSTGPLLDGQGKVIGTVLVAVDVTERRRAEELARKWMTICEHAEWGIVVGSNDGLTLEMMNPAFAEMHGYTVEELIGTPLADVFAPESRSDVSRHIRVAHKKGHHTYESSHIRKDGSTFPVLVNVSVAKDENGEILFRVVNVQDITKLKRFENLLRKSRETFAALLDAISEAAFLLSPDGVILAANQATVDRMHKKFQDVIGKSIFDLFDYELAKSRKTFVDEVVTTGRPVEFEDERQGRFLHHSLYPSFDRQGAVIAVAGYSIDITERKQTHAELKKYQTQLEDLVKERTDELQKINHQLTLEVAEREQAQHDLQMSVSLLRAVFDAISDGLLVGNLVHGVESLNRRFKEMWRLSEEFVKNADSAKMLEFCASQTNDPAEFVRRIEEIYSPSVTESFDEIEMKDGRVLERRSKLYLMGNKTYGRVWSYKDLTERIRTQRELLVARDQAQAADHAKSAFLAMMSHEIRTPINAIMGLSYLCLQTEVTPKQNDYLEKIHASSESLLRIINDVLDFSKIEAGRLELELVDFNLANVVRNVVGMLSVKADQKALKLLFCIDDRIPTQLIGDPLRLEQVIKNLADNAVKFTEKGQVVISVELVGELTDQVKLKFSVSDTGIGLTQEQISNLFQPFVQADTSTTRKYGGSGLGLSICRRLVEMMGGQISIESRPGQGTTFTFILDLGCKEAAPAKHSDEEIVCTVMPSRVPAREKELEVAKKIAGAKILLIEDNEINQQVAMELLARAGLVVTVANDGQEGVDACNAGQYDAVLTDVQMPVMDGYRAASKIRENPRFADLPIIAMTAHAMAGEREKCISAGMNDYVTKPIDPYLLYTVLLKWIPSKEIAAGEDAFHIPPGAEPGVKNDSFPKLVGIDVESGITRVGGDHQFYKRMLQKFSQSHSDDANQIAHALAIGDVETAGRLAHTVKGVSGSLGADALRLVSQELELIIKDGESGKLVQCLDAVRSELQQVISSISLLDQAAVSSPTLNVHGPVAGHAIENQEVLTLFDKLKALMVDNDTASWDLLNDIENRLPGSSFEVNMKSVRDALEQYDFDRGLSILDEIVGQLNFREGED